MFLRDMVCLRNTCVDTLHEGDIDDIYDNNWKTNNKNRKKIIIVIIISLKKVSHLVTLIFMYRF